MTYSASCDECIECGKPAPHNLICDECAPDYADKLVTDECTCVACRSDLAGIVPCLQGDVK